MGFNSGFKALKNKVYIIGHRSAGDLKKLLECSVLDFTIKTSTWNKQRDVRCGAFLLAEGTISSN